MTNTLKHFDVLAKHGMQVIPLHSGGKNPIQDAWQLGYDLTECRAYFERNPRLNLGLRLGTIVDVEGDSPHANQLINDLIGDYPHPSYTSRKSIHHLFLNPDPRLTRIVFQEVEFRGNKHQSVLPPSVVGQTQYKWKTIVFPIPPMPERLLRFFNKVKRKKTKHAIKPGHMKISCLKCKKVCYIHQKRFQEELAVFKSLCPGRYCQKCQEINSVCRRWLCQDCREVDIRSLCRQVRGRCLVETM